MPRSLGNRLLTCGMLSIPVSYFTAASDEDIKFNQITPAGNRTAQRLVDSVTEKDVARDELQKGYQLDDTMVLLDPAEIAALAPAGSKEIAIECFVDEAAVSAVRYDKSYYIGPTKLDGAAKPYSLLLAAMEQTHKVAIARACLKDTKQHLVAVRVVEGVLVMSTLYYDDEVREFSFDRVMLSDKETAMAVQLVEALSDEFDPAAYTDGYRERLMAFITAKAQDAGAKVEPIAEAPVKTTEDLMELLKASVEGAKAKKKGKAA